MVILPPFRKACAIKIKCEIFTMYYFIDFAVLLCTRKKNERLKGQVTRKKEYYREKKSQKTEQSKKNPISQFHWPRNQWKKFLLRNVRIISHTTITTIYIYDHLIIDTHTHTKITTATAAATSFPQWLRLIPYRPIVLKERNSIRNNISPS